MQNLTRAYIAGIIDGEGHIGIHIRSSKNGRTAWLPVVRVSSSSEELIQWLTEHAGMGHVNRLNSGMIFWTPDRQGQVDLLEQVLPYLVIKKRQAEILLEYYRDRPLYVSKGVKVRGAGAGLGEEETARRMRLAEECKALNGRKTQPYVAKNPRYGKANPPAETE